MARAQISARLASLRQDGLYRRLRTIESEQGPRVRIDGRDVLLLCSNNYLGLAADPRVKRAAADAAARWGAGAGASRSVSGTMEAHLELERRLAQLEGTESALLFGSGYLANVGVLQAVATAGELYSDELNHASIVDGCRLARATTVVYRHADTEDLRRRLAERPDRSAPATIVTDGVFSMDGDVAPLAELRAIADEHDALLIVDEAHGTGCIGPGGAGALAAAGVRADVVVGTLGKALGSYGAYAACSAQLRELLINSARSFIFATAPPPPAVGAALQALAILQSEPQRVARLRANAEILQRALRDEGIDVESATQIIPLIVGSAQAAVDAAERALQDGVFAQAIRPPTVAEGTSRLRLTVMSEHEPEQLREAAATLARAVGR